MVVYLVSNLADKMASRWVMMWGFAKVGNLGSTKVDWKVRVLVCLMVTPKVRHWVENLDVLLADWKEIKKDASKVEMMVAEKVVEKGKKMVEMSVVVMGSPKEEMMELLKAASMVLMKVALRVSSMEQLWVVSLVSMWAKQKDKRSVDYLETSKALLSVASRVDQMEALRALHLAGKMASWKESK